MTGTTTPTEVADRIEAVRDELAAIRSELNAAGQAPHADLHDVIKTAERSISLNGSLPAYLAELRG